MDNTTALSQAIFAINTLLHPDASSDSDFHDFEALAEQTIERLVAMRDGDEDSKYAILSSNIELDPRTFDEYGEASEYADFLADDLGGGDGQIQVVRLVPTGDPR